MARESTGSTYSVEESSEKIIEIEKNIQKQMRAIAYVLLE